MFALALYGAAPSPALDTAKLDLLLDRLAEKNKGMGSLALVQDGQILYAHAAGYRHIAADEQTPATPATRYRLASITKTYTAVMILQLAEEGKLTLTDPLDRWFPQIPNAKKITLEQILHHRSGIRTMEVDGSWGRQPRTREEVVARIAAGQPEFEPDTQVRYSNSGYQLLGQIVERVGGQPYAEALKARIAAKLGLAATYALSTGQADPARDEAVSYMYLNGWRESPETDLSITGGAGSILATPADMARFIQGLFDGKLISAASLKRMTTIRDGEGMGLVTFTLAGKTFYGHTGGGASSGAWLAYNPEDKIALAYATNHKVYPVATLVAGVADIYYHRPFEVPTFAALQLSPEVLDRYVGTYAAADSPGAKARITRQGGTLFFQPPGAPSAMPLEATTENKFEIPPAVAFEFDATQGQMRVRRRGVERVFTREK